MLKGTEAVALHPSPWFWIEREQRCRVRMSHGGGQEGRFVVVVSVPPCFPGHGAPRSGACGKRKYFSGLGSARGD